MWIIGCKLKLYSLYFKLNQGEKKKKKKKKKKNLFILQIKYKILILQYNT